MAVKIAIYHVESCIEEGEEGKLQGAAAWLFQNFHRTVFGNVSFIVKRTEDDTVIQDASHTNGKYKNDSTFSDLFRRKEADLFGLPLEYGTCSAYVVPSCPFVQIPGAALHAPHLSVSNQDILNTLNIFPLGIVYGIFGCLSILVLLLRFTWKVKFSHSTSSLAKCLINQTSLNLKLLKCTTLILAWLFCSFAIMEIYEQSINADCVTLDYSSVVENVMDLDRHKSFKPVFVQGDYIREQFKRSQNPVKSRIWNRKNKLIALLNYELISATIKTDHVIVGCDTGIASLGKYSCEALKDHHRKNSRRKFLISRKDFGSLDTGFYHRVNLTKEVERLIWHKSLAIGQAGLAQIVGDQALKSLFDRSSATKGACLYDNKQDLYDDVQTLESIKIDNFSSFLNIFIVFLSFSVTLLIVERTLYYLQIARHSNT